MEDSSPSSASASSGPSDEPPTSPGVESTTERALSERELVRLEFYRTYDVMTGVRIAGTLGGFFGLMVLLVLYKSRCKGRSLSDEHLEAAITAVVEDEKLEEDKDVMAALNMSGISFYGPRRSLGNMSAPPYMRFASFAGGTAMMHPPTAKSVLRGRASLPISDVRHHMYSLRASPSNERDLLAQPPAKVYKEEEEEEEDSFEEGGGTFLRVPGSSRRLSSITCSSSDASYLYLERRTSALEMGFPPPRPSICKTDRNALLEAPWDFYYPIDIQVIQPTPEMTPAGSEVNLHIRPEDRSKATLSVPGMAPLASMTSSGLTTEVEGASVTVSDTVFIDEGPEVDTEDEIEDELSTDSEDNQRYGKPDEECRAAALQHPSMNPFAAEPDSDVVHALKTGSPKPSRRFSAPADRKPIVPKTGNFRLVPFSSTGDDDEQYPACSKTVLGLTHMTGPEVELPETRFRSEVESHSGDNSQEAPERPERTEQLVDKSETELQLGLKAEVVSQPDKPEVRLGEADRPEVRQLPVRSTEPGLHQGMLQDVGATGLQQLEVSRKQVHEQKISPNRIEARHERTAPEPKSKPVVVQLEMKPWLRVERQEVTLEPEIDRRKRHSLGLPLSAGLPVGVDRQKVRYSLEVDRHAVPKIPSESGEEIRETRFGCAMDREKSTQGSKVVPKPEEELVGKIPSVEIDQNKTRHPLEVSAPEMTIRVECEKLAPIGAEACRQRNRLPRRPEVMEKPEVGSPPEVESEVESISRVSSSSAHAPIASLSETREIRTSEGSTTSRQTPTSEECVTSQQVGTTSESCSTSEAKHYYVPGAMFSRSLDKLQPDGQGGGGGDGDRGGENGTELTTGFNLTGFSISASHSCDHLVQNIQEVRIGVNKSMPTLQPAWSQETLF